MKFDVKNRTTKTTENRAAPNSHRRQAGGEVFSSLASPSAPIQPDMAQFGSQEIGQMIRDRNPLPAQVRRMYPDAFEEAVKRAHVRPTASKRGAGLIAFALLMIGALFLALAYALTR